MVRPARLLLSRAATTLVAFFGLVSPAFAQDEPKPFTYVTMLETEKQIFQWVAVVLFIVGCVAIAFKNPHRSHLD